MKNYNPYILGLDVGTNSIGWAVVDCEIEKGREYEPKPVSLRALNSRVFLDMLDAKTQVPKNQKRRTARLVVRNYLSDPYPLNEELNEVLHSYIADVHEYVQEDLVRKNLSKHAKTRVAHVEDIPLEASPLMWAVRAEDIDELKKLIAEGVNLNEQSFGETAAMVAVRNGDEEKLELLIEAGVDLGIKNNEGQTAGEIANEKGDVECLKIIEAAESELDALIPKEPDVKVVDHGLER